MKLDDPLPAGKKRRRDASELELGRRKIEMSEDLKRTAALYTIRDEDWPGSDSKIIRNLRAPKKMTVLDVGKGCATRSNRGHLVRADQSGGFFAIKPPRKPFSSQNRCE